MSERIQCGCDDLASSARRRSRRLAGRRAPAHRQGQAPGTRSGSGIEGARHQGRRLPVEPEGARRRHGDAGVRAARRRRAARAQARRRPDPRRGAGGGPRGPRAAGGPRPRLLDGGPHPHRRAGAVEEGRPGRPRAWRAQGAAAPGRARGDRELSGPVAAVDRAGGPYACVDVGSNTTRLLVAECRAGGVRELMTQRVYTRLGKSLDSAKRIPADKVAEAADVVAQQVRHARELGAASVRVVATAAIRQAANRDELVEAIERSAGVPAHVLSDGDEARLAFAGATRMLAAPPAGAIAVVDVGGGSTEIAIGTLGEGVTWSRSFRIGSGYLADSYLRSDPPGAGELDAARQHASGMFEGLRTPAVERAVACGGSAASLRRMAGAELTHDALERAVQLLASAPRADIAERFELDPERVHLLPAGVLILDAVSTALGAALKIGGGGLREGVVLELAAAA